MSDRFAALLREARQSGQSVEVPAEVVGELLSSPPAVAFAAALQQLHDDPGCCPDELDGIRAGLLALAGREPITLSTAAAPDEDTVSLTRPVPQCCWLLLSAGSPYEELVPAYACLGTGPHVARLGLRSVAHPSEVVPIRLLRAHAAGAPVEVLVRV